MTYTEVLAHHKLPLATANSSILDGLTAVSQSSKQQDERRYSVFRFGQCFEKRRPDCLLLCNTDHRGDMLPIQASERSLRRLCFVSVGIPRVLDRRCAKLYLARSSIKAAQCNVFIKLSAS